MLGGGSCKGAVKSYRVCLHVCLHDCVYSAVNCILNGMQLLSVFINFALYTTLLLAIESGAGGSTVLHPLVTEDQPSLLSHVCCSSHVW